MDYTEHRHLSLMLLFTCCSQVLTGKKNKQTYKLPVMLTDEQVALLFRPSFYTSQKISLPMEKYFFYNKIKHNFILIIIDLLSNYYLRTSLKKKNVANICP